MTESARPIFIVGSGRSGTSIMTWCLGQPPHILPLPETNWIGKLSADLKAAYELGSARGEYSHLSAMGLTNAEFYEAFGDAINDLILHYPTRINLPQRDDAPRTSSPGDLRRWVDGTPENSFYIPGLLRLFPRAKFIHILRDVESIVRSLLNFSKAGGADYTEQAAYEYWLRSVRACVRAERDFGPERVLRIRYDDLPSAPEEVFRSCLSFLDEPFFPECLVPLQNKINSSNVPPDFDPYDPSTDPLLRERAQRLSRRLLKETRLPYKPNNGNAGESSTSPIRAPKHGEPSKGDRLLVSTASGGTPREDLKNPTDVTWESASKAVLKYASQEGNLDEVAGLLSRVLRFYMKPNLYPRYFKVFGGTPDMDYWKLLKAWAQRANMVVQRARQGELRVIRYEDLTHDFVGTLKPVLAWLEVDNSEQVIEAINAQTSFEKITGRSRGAEAQHVFRKGAVGEWIDVLSAEDKVRAWNLAGGQLSSLGYTQDGHLVPLPGG